MAILVSTVAMSLTTQRGLAGYLQLFGSSNAEPASHGTGLSRIGVIIAQHGAHGVTCTLSGSEIKPSGSATCLRWGSEWKARPSMSIVAARLRNSEVVLGIGSSLIACKYDVLVTLPTGADTISLAIGYPVVEDETIFSHSETLALNCTLSPPHWY